MTDDPVRTFVKLRGRAAIPFQEYFVRNRARGQVEEDRTARGAIEPVRCPRRSRQFESSAAVVLAPSNPFVSLGPILALKIVRRALRCDQGTGGGDQSAGRRQDRSRDPPTR